MCQPQVGAVLQHRLLQHVDVRRTATVVDVVRIRRIVDGHHIRARGRIRQRGGLGGGAIGAVDHHANAVDLRRNRLGQVEQVPVQAVGGLLDDAADAGARRAAVLQIQQRMLDLLLHRVVELRAAGGEELDAVVGHRIVRRGDHHAHVGAVVVRQERHRRRRQHSHAQHVDALRRHARRHRRGEHLAGHPRVTADDRGRTTLARVRPARQDGGGRGPQFHRQRRGEGLVRESADTVGAEKTGHVRCNS